MGLEEQILRYYSKVFNFIFILILILIFFYTIFVFNKKIILVSKLIKIEKGETVYEVLDKNIKNFSKFDFRLTLIFFYFKNFVTKSFIHYGDFQIEKRVNVLEFLDIISKPTNLLNKITIVEGWSQSQLNAELSKYFEDFRTVPYESIIADTYFFNKNSNFDVFLKKLKKIKFDYINKYHNYEINKLYTQNEIMVIGSLIEKEGLDYQDKRKISSVIFNRLKKNMKLQIDATVLFAITNGEYNLKRKLLLKDLKIDNPYNTYKITGLPPYPISYVGKKTIDIVFENYKSDFLFYFFNNSLNSHVFSKSYKDHKLKLNEYRNK